MEEEQNESFEKTFILYIWITKMQKLDSINVAVADFRERKLKFGHFYDSKCLSQLETLILYYADGNSQLGKTKVCYLMNSDPQISKYLKSFLEEKFGFCKQYSPNTIVDYLRAKELIKSISREEKLTQNSKGAKQNFDLIQENLKPAFGLMATLVDNELKTMRDCFKIEEISLSRLIRLDAKAIIALDLLSDKDNEFQPEIGVYKASDSNEQLSLYQILNNCNTKMGSRKLKRWLLQPLCKPKTLEMRLDMVEMFSKEIEFASEVKKMIKQFPDIEKVALKMFKIHNEVQCSAGISDIYLIYLTLKQLSSFHLFVTSFKFESKFSEKIVKKHILNSLDSISEESENIMKFIKGTIDLKAEKRSTLRVNPKMDKRLADISNKLELLVDRVKQLQSEAEIELSGLVNLGENDKYAMVFRMKSAHFFDAVKNDKAMAIKYKKLSVRAGKAFFVSTELTEINEDFDEYTQRYKNLQDKIIRKVLKELSVNFDLFNDIAEDISNYDVLLNFGMIAASSTLYCRPTFNTDGILELNQARHPMIQRASEEGCVPNNLFMDQKSRFHIVSGPNMGGKSTFLRTCAINILLAHIGSFCCAQKANFPPIDAIITRSGANDYQTEGVSTFLAEMIESRYMLASCTERSFIVIDELGRSTSSTEGYALVGGIIKYLIKEKNPYCLFSTHFHNLKAALIGIPTVKVFFMTSIKSDHRVKMKYQIAEGSIDQSFALNVISTAKYSQKFLEQNTIKNTEITESKQSSKGSSKSLKETLKINASANYKIYVLKAFRQYRSEIEPIEKSDGDEQEIQSKLAELQTKYSEIFKEIKRQQEEYLNQTTKEGFYSPDGVISKQLSQFIQLRQKINLKISQLNNISVKRKTVDNKDSLIKNSQYANLRILQVNSIKQYYKAKKSGRERRNIQVLFRNQRKGQNQRDCCPSEHQKQFNDNSRPKKDHFCKNGILSEKNTVQSIFELEKCKFWGALKVHVKPIPNTFLNFIILSIRSLAYLQNQKDLAEQYIKQLDYFDIKEKDIEFMTYNEFLGDKNNILEQAIRLDMVDVKIQLEDVKGELSWERGTKSQIMEDNDKMKGYAFTLKNSSEMIELRDMTQGKMTINMVDFDDKDLFKTGVWNRKNRSQKEFNFITSEFILSQKLGQLNDRIIVRDLTEINKSGLQQYFALKMGIDTPRYLHLYPVIDKKTNEPLDPYIRMGQVSHYLKNIGVTKQALLSYVTSLGINEKQEEIDQIRRIKVMNKLRSPSMRLESFRVDQMRSDNTVFNFYDLRIINQLAIRTRLEMMDKPSVPEEKKEKQIEYFYSVLNTYVHPDTVQFFRGNLTMEQSKLIKGLFWDIDMLNLCKYSTGIEKYEDERMNKILSEFTYKDVEYIKEFFEEFEEKFTFDKMVERDVWVIISNYCYRKGFEDSINFAIKLRQVLTLQKNNFISVGFLFELLGKNQVRKRFMKFLGLTQDMKKLMEAKTMEQINQNQIQKQVEIEFQIVYYFYIDQYRFRIQIHQQFQEFKNQICALFIKNSIQNERTYFLELWYGSAVGIRLSLTGLVI